MYKLAIAILGCFLFFASPICPAQNYPSDPQAIAFIKKTYDDKLYEEDTFLRSHCTKKMLKKLTDAFEYECDSNCYASWLFRSGAQDEKYNWGQNAENTSKVLMIVAKDEHWYVYSALDMGWRFTNWVYLIKSGNSFLIDDVITVENEVDETND